MSGFIFKVKVNIIVNQNIENLYYNYYKGKSKSIKLNIFMLSENNTTILSPILGQYGIKPLDFYKS